MRLMPVVRMALFSLLASCAAMPPAPVSVARLARTVDYQQEVKPLLEKRCTVCHSCYNSPCQLKLDSFEGADRGAMKKAIYNATRLSSMEPTRLFIDAKTTEEWRKKEFFSVTESTSPEGLNNSIMIELLDHKMKNPRSKGEYRPEASDLACVSNQEELGAYLEKHPNGGMPFGFPPLKQEEFDLLSNWLAQGAKGPSQALRDSLAAPKPADAKAIETWETFLNLEDPKHLLTARYIFEHLFLAHIKFGGETGEFFELVRSRTPPGAPLDLVATVRPYDDPGTRRVFYRFLKITSTIVVKTHLVFALDDGKLKRLNELFIDAPWLGPPKGVGYDPVISANPFVAFEQIPPRSRYLFLLENNYYVIKTFIHGPVCKGQIALNVLDDHFWVLFLDPDADLTVANPGFLRLQSDKLRLPVEKGSDFGIFDALTDEYKKKALEFYKARQDFYEALNYTGQGYEAIWKGDAPSDSPGMTVYRHFESASVHRGFLGNLPKTVWVIDFPLLERIYYSLVAGFDVYGTVGHQLALRNYMDALRVEGESYFLDLLPSSDRKGIMQSWYGDVDLEKINFHPSGVPARIVYATTDAKRELLEGLVNNHFPPAMKIGFDPVNYFGAGERYPELPENYGSPGAYLEAFRALSKPGAAVLGVINDFNANLAYLRIRMKSGKDVSGTIVVNRWHDNVAFLFGEGGKLDTAKDTMNFIPALIGSYPNYFFEVLEEDLPDFFDLLMNFEKGAKDLKRLGRYGINRADERLWEAYDWFQLRFNEEEPVDGGLLDLNRYYFNADG